MAFDFGFDGAVAPPMTTSPSPPYTTSPSLSSSASVRSLPVSGAPSRCSLIHPPLPSDTITITTTTHPTKTFHPSILLAHLETTAPLTRLNNLTASQDAAFKEFWTSPLSTLQNYSTQHAPIRDVLSHFFTIFDTLFFASSLAGNVGFSYTIGPKGLSACASTRIVEHREQKRLVPGTGHLASAMSSTSNLLALTRTTSALSSTSTLGDERPHNASSTTLSSATTPSLTRARTNDSSRTGDAKVHKTVIEIYSPPRRLLGNRHAPLKTDVDLLLREMCKAYLLTWACATCVANEAEFEKAWRAIAAVVEENTWNDARFRGLCVDLLDEESGVAASMERRAGPSGGGDGDGASIASASMSIRAPQPAVVVSSRAEQRARMDASGVDMAGDNIIYNASPVVPQHATRREPRRGVEGITSPIARPVSTPYGPASLALTSTSTSGTTTTTTTSSTSESQRARRLRLGLALPFRALQKPMLAVDADELMHPHPHARSHHPGAVGVHEREVSPRSGPGESAGAASWWWSSWSSCAPAGAGSWSWPAAWPASWSSSSASSSKDGDWEWAWRGADRIPDASRGAGAQQGQGAFGSREKHVWTRRDGGDEERQVGSGDGDGDGDGARQARKAGTRNCCAWWIAP